MVKEKGIITSFYSKNFSRLPSTVVTVQVLPPHFSVLTSDTCFHPLFLTYLYSLSTPCTSIKATIIFLGLQLNKCIPVNGAICRDFRGQLLVRVLLYVIDYLLNAPDPIHVSLVFLNLYYNKGLFVS